MAINNPYHRIWRPLHTYTNSIDAMFEDEEEKSSDNLQYLDSDLYVDRVEKNSLLTQHV